MNFISETIHALEIATIICKCNDIDTLKSLKLLVSYKVVPNFIIGNCCQLNISEQHFILINTAVSESPKVKLVTMYK